MDLFKLDLMRSKWPPCPIEDDEPGACSAIVYRSNKDIVWVIAGLLLGLALRNNMAGSSSREN